MSPKVIAISGSPGVGKTRVAALLAKRLGAELISITELVKTGKVPYTWDEKRKTKEITISDVKRAVAHSVKPGVNVVEGHLAHLTGATVVFILRCNPEVLRKRLLVRKWPKSKVEENVQAEMLDIITAESLGRRKARVYEIDTTYKSPTKTAVLILRILASPVYAKKFAPGRIKWLRPKEIQRAF